MSDEWAALANLFVDGAYATVRGRVRTMVIHRQLVEHLPPPPARVLDVGGGAGHQSLPLARIGHLVTLLDPSPTMLGRAAALVAAEPPEVQARMRLLEGAGEDLDAVTAGERFDAVLCHGVLLYLDDPEPVVRAMAEALDPDGVMSIMTLAPHGPAARAALEHRWADAVDLLDATREVGPLGVDTRADSVTGLTELLHRHGIEVETWLGVLLLAEWLDLPQDVDVHALAEAELAFSRRDPYRAAARSFHLIGRAARR